jgi:hypothetical protein
MKVADSRPDASPPGRDGHGPTGRDGWSVVADRGRDDHDELPVHPLRREPIDPPPPLREQLPLPRRRGQEHLAPQLRTLEESDTGTPFAPFAPVIPGQRTAPDRTPAAEFQNGSRQARTRTRGRRRAATD